MLFYLLAILLQLVYRHNVSVVFMLENLRGLIKICLITGSPILEYT